MSDKKVMEVLIGRLREIDVQLRFLHGKVDIIYGILSGSTPTQEKTDISISAYDRLVQEGRKNG